MARAILNNDIIDVIYDKICGYPLEEAYKILDNHRNGAYIPIEWIDGYIKRKIKVGGMYAEMLYIYDMLKDWEKENEHKESD